MRDAAADALGVDPRLVAVAETGTIGVALDIEAVTTGAGGGRGPVAGGRRAVRPSIMTTDAGPKRCTVQAGGVTVSAQAKGRE
jgi:N-acetylglutamate synthase/N-acetylornithine aminotransferase